MQWLKRKLIDLRVNRWAKRRQREFNAHLLTLSNEEQRQLAEGSHNSQSHDRADNAQATAEQFQEELLKLGISATVEIGYYHLNRLVLTVDLLHPPKNIKALPRFFHGYEVKYSLPETSS